MSDFKCPFCKSTELKIKSDYVELKSDGEYGPVESFCCEGQKRNAIYMKKNFHPDDAPDPDEISKW